MLRLLYQLIGVHYAAGNFNAVELAVRSLLATVPNDLASLQFLGLVYYRTGRTDEAMHIFDSAPAAHDAVQKSAANSGDGSSLSEAYSAAAACRVEATRRDSNLAQAWYDLGLTLHQLGRPDRAVFAFRSALIARPTFPEAAQALYTIEPCANEPMIDEHDISVTDAFESVEGRLLPGFHAREAQPAWRRESMDDPDE